jgi:hypothetical protein
MLLGSPDKQHRMGMVHPSSMHNYAAALLVSVWWYRPRPRCRTQDYPSSPDGRRSTSWNHRWLLCGIQLFDGTPFNAEDPIAYLNSLKIKRDFSIAEVVLDSRPSVAA